MSPTPRVAFLVGALALSAIVVPVWAAGLAIAAVLAACAADALLVRRPPEVERDLPAVIVRGVPARLHVAAGSARARLRQPRVPDVTIDPAEGVATLDAVVIARRRGRHVVPPPATRVGGPLGLGSWTHDVGEETELLVYPNLPGARRFATAIRQGRMRDEGRARGPLGLGTEFESVRDYSPDDDVRQINWRASARLGKPMSNQYRLERDRDVMCLIDCGRLMGAPLGDATRLDVAVDAAVFVAAVAEEYGDRAGLIAFDSEIRRDVAPRRRGAAVVARALFDVEPSTRDSDYEAAFRRLGESRRAFALVLTDLLEETAARSLVEALPALARRHVVAVASAADVDLAALLEHEPARTIDVYRTGVALDVLQARTRVSARLRGIGVEVIEARPDGLAAACVRSYLRSKALARL